MYNVCWSKTTGEVFIERLHEPQTHPDYRRIIVSTDTYTKALDVLNALYMWSIHKELCVITHEAVESYIKNRYVSNYSTSRECIGDV